MIAQSPPPSAHRARLALRLAAWACLLALAACGSAGESGTTGARRAAHADFLNFSLCMRRHGVSNFPDPSPQGGIHVTPGSGGINPGSPAVQSAQRLCMHLLPGGGPPAELSEQQKLQAFKFARCMRGHGVPDYPDPVFQGPVIIHNYSRNGIDPNSPAFQKAARSCGNPI